MSNYSDFRILGINLFLNLLLALYFISPAPGFRARRFDWQNDVKVHLKNDEAVDSLVPSLVPVSLINGESFSSTGLIGTAKAKLPSYVGMIEDESDDRGSLISATNWSGKLKSKRRTDSLSIKNLAFEDKAEDIRREMKSDMREKEKVNKKERFVRSVREKKVVKEERRRLWKDQGRIIGIELLSGDQRHSRNKEKLYFANNTASTVNVTDGNFVVEKEKESSRIKGARLYRDENNEEGNVPLTRSNRRKRDMGESYNRERVELEKINLQFEHLPDSRKTRFCSYLRKDSIKDPLEMLMALLGTVYSKSDGESGAHWDKRRSVKLSGIQDRIARQKLILIWACEDRREGENRIFRNALRSISSVAKATFDVDEQREMNSRRRKEFSNLETRDPRLIVKPIPTERLFKEIVQRRRSSTCQPKISRSNSVTELHETMIIDTDEDTSDYQN